MENLQNALVTNNQVQLRQKTWKTSQNASITNNQFQLRQRHVKHQSIFRLQTIIIN